MVQVLTKRDVDILESRGLWEASSYIHKVVNRSIRKNLPLEIRYINQAHRIIFSGSPQESIGGVYRRHNGPELKRIDGTLLPMTDWKMVPNAMAELGFELKVFTSNFKSPSTEQEYYNIVSKAVKFSHRLASIHPYENGNGRTSRLLLNAMLLRVGLPAIAIKVDKPRYLRAMRQGDDSDFGMLENLVLQGLIEVKYRQIKALVQKRRDLARNQRLSKRQNKRRH